MSTVSSSNISEPVLCCYINKTQRIQSGKIAHYPGGHLEKVIFPSEKFLFEAPADAELAIYIELAGNTILLDNIPCSHLQTQTASKKTLELAH
ncbi:MAG: DUF1830 domain-containing protein [Waterburya sp.]